MTRAILKESKRSSFHRLREAKQLKMWTFSVSQKYKNQSESSCDVFKLYLIHLYISLSGVLCDLNFDIQYGPYCMLLYEDKLYIMMSWNDSNTFSIGQIAIPVWFDFNSAWIVLNKRLYYDSDMLFQSGTTCYGTYVTLYPNELTVFDSQYVIFNIVNSCTTNSIKWNVP